MWQTYLTVAAVAYLLGSIPFGYILVKLFLKQDIRQTGSGNIGATNVARSGKKGLAIATLLLDAGKGAAAVICAKTIYFAMIGANDSANGRELSAALGALFAIVGHVFPAWLRFKGGKGVATAVGAFFGVNPFATAFAFLIFAIVFAFTRIVSLGSMLGCIAFVIGLTAVPWWGYTRTQILICCASALLIILKHHANIRRLLNGTEPKFTSKKSTPPDPIQVEKNA